MGLAALVLTGAAWLRGAEYDEQYTLFLTAGMVRPDWPEAAFPAGRVAAAQTGHASLAGIARDLRVTDVHPPLYFWAVAGWRRVFGPGLFAARMLSVLFGLVSLGLTGAIARRCGIRPVMAMLLTLGCYGFVYTNAIARGFAAAEMLTLGGVALLLGRRPALAGVCLGAACCCNYLAVFVAAAAIVVAGAWPAALATVPFLAVDAWFFAAQHGARPGQFPPFAVWPSLLRLAKYQVAAVFGGLPLYVDGVGRVVVGAVVGAVTVAMILVIGEARPWRRPIRLTAAASVAPPIGLLLLGFVFDNTPIELRYLSFGLPFVALLVAWASSPAGGVRRVVLPVVLAVQCAGVAGLLLSPRTMQPYRVAAAEAAGLVADGVVLVPRGNDGVGVVGAFAIEAPPALPILLLRPSDPIADRIREYRRVVLADLPQDRDSIATIEAMRAVLSKPDWRRVAVGSDVTVYQRIGMKE
jgi:hypothetical protein